MFEAKTWQSFAHRIVSLQESSANKACKFNFLGSQGGEAWAQAGLDQDVCLQTHHPGEAHRGVEAAMDLSYLLWFGFVQQAASLLLPACVATQGQHLNISSFLLGLLPAGAKVREPFPSRTCRPMCCR